MADKPIQLINGRMQEVEGTAVSSGVASAGKMVALNSAGKLDPSLFFSSLPEYSQDPASPQPGEAWVRKTASAPEGLLSHTLLQLGLTAPGVTYTYELRFRTLAGTNVTL